MRVVDDAEARGIDIAAAPKSAQLPSRFHADTHEALPVLPVLTTDGAASCAWPPLSVPMPEAVFLGVAAHRTEVEAAPVIDRNRRGGRLGVGPCGKVGGGRGGHPKRDQGGRRQQNFLHVSSFRHFQRNYRSSQFQVACAYSVKSSQNAVAEKPHPRQMYVNATEAGVDSAAVQPNKKAGARPAFSSSVG